MRILFIAALPPPITGQHVASDALYRDLVSRGHSVTLINLSKSGFRQGVDSLARIGDVIRVIGRVWKSRHGHDLVYLTNSESVAGNLRDLALLCVLGAQRKRTWVHLHGGAGMRVLLSHRHPLLQRLNRLVLRDLGGVVVLGGRLTSIFDGYVPTERVRVVKNFAANELFASEASFKKKWLVASTDRPVLKVLFLSNHLPGKGHEELLRAIELLPGPALERLEFNFAGAFESDAARDSFLARLGRFPNAKHHGIVKGEVKQQLLLQSHVLCLPTYYPYEGQPISLLEAYAAGCAVITTDHSGIFDIFEPGVQGWAVEKRDPNAIACALVDLVSNPSNAAVMARANWSLAEAEFRPERHLHNLRVALSVES